VWHGLDDGGEPDEARFLCVVVDGVTILNTYVPQGFKIDSPKYAYKLEWFRRLRRYFRTHFSPDEPVIWCGDMNVAPEPLDVHSPEKHLTHVCFHEDVRRAYKDTLAWGFTDVFRALHPTTQQFTFWDYRQPSSVEANKGWRIDHILVTASLAPRCARVGVDMTPRIGQNPSDHTVLWADFRDGTKGGGASARTHAARARTEKKKT
ncbi:MAG: exodeoxyribonuclease III, partial [Nitrospirales bacterium]